MGGRTKEKVQIERQLVRLGYRPHLKQRPFHKNNLKFRGIITGVGFGKSSAGVAEMIRDSMKYPGSFNLIFAPTYRMLQNVTMREFWKFCPPEIIASHNRGEQIITLVNGTEIIYLSGDNERNIDRLRGLTLGSAYLDEVALSPYYVWEVVIARMRHSKGSKRIWITTTPKGRNWVFSLFVKHQNPRTKDLLPNKDAYKAFKGTTFDNPYTDDEYKNTLKATYSGIFGKQELYGDFVGFEGLVYGDFSMEVHCPDKIRTERITNYICGVDWGFTNPAALIVIGLDGDGRAYIIDEYYGARLQVGDLIAKAKIFNEKYGIDSFHADPSRPEYIAQFNQAGLSTSGTKAEVLPRIEHMTTYLHIREDGEPRLYLLENKCPNTLNEFGLYRFPEAKEDKPTQDKPIKDFDHCLVGDNLVTTSTGDKKIKDVVRGDLVLTRGGYNMVLKSALTLQKQVIYRLFLSNGRVLDATGGHPIYVKDKGFTSLDSLGYAYILEDVNNNLWHPKKYDIRESHSEDTRNQLDNPIVDTTGQTEHTYLKESNTYIEKFGKTTMEKYLRGMSYTIKIITLITTTYLTLNASLIKNMVNAIIGVGAESTCLKSENSQRCGMGAKKVANGIVNMVRGHGKIAGETLENVLCAVKATPTILRNPDTVLVIARQRLLEREDVYDLTIQGEHEFYANGVLVHNSMDAIGYALWSLKVGGGVHSLGSLDDLFGES